MLGGYIFWKTRNKRTMWKFFWQYYDVQLWMEETSTITSCESIDNVSKFAKAIGYLISLFSKYIRRSKIYWQCNKIKKKRSRKRNQICFFFHLYLKLVQLPWLIYNTTTTISFFFLGPTPELSFDSTKGEEEKRRDLNCVRDTRGN